jgi:hypothetical protein
MNNKLTKISKEINTLKIQKNQLLDNLICLLQTNGSRHKQFVTKLEIEKIDIDLKIKVKKKEEMLINMFKSI